MKTHPYATVFPLLAETELQALADDIRERGQLHPVVLDPQGQIVDGRNRAAACELLGIEPETVIRSFVDDDDLLRFVLSENLHRRHLTPVQLGYVASELANLRNGSNRFEKKVALQACRATKPAPNAGETHKNGNPSAETGAESKPKPVSRKQAAKAVGVSERTVATVNKARKTATPELDEAIKSGRVTAAAAEEIAKLAPEKQLRALANPKFKGRPSGGTGFNPAEWDADVAAGPEPEPEPVADDVPAHLRDSLAGIKGYRSIQKRMHDLKREILSLAETPIGGWIRREDTKRHIDQVIEDLRVAQFFDICPRCKKEAPRKQCSLCRGAGWICRGSSGYLTDEDKRWLESNGIKVTGR